MTHRLFFVLPDVTSARQMADDLLLARVEDRRMHFLAKRDRDLGALFGAWVSSMVATQIPNSRLKVFEEAIENGKILLIVDFPMSRSSEINSLVTSPHPEAISGGQDPIVPAFP